jgi:hypothetical protein
VAWPHAEGRGWAGFGLGHASAWWEAVMGGGGIKQWPGAQAQGHFTLGIEDRFYSLTNMVTLLNFRFSTEQ